MEATQLDKRFQKTRRGASLTADVYGKIPPQAIDMEESVLGTILLYAEAFDIVAEILKPECFYVEAHKLIYETMQSLSANNRQIDLLTVIEELKKREEIDLVGGPYYVTCLTNKIKFGNNVLAHARIVFEKFLLREIIRISAELQREAFEDSTDAFELLEYAESSITEIGTKNVSTGMIRIDGVLVEAIKKIEEWRANDDSITGIPSGFKDLDRATRGWQNGDLIIIGARTSTGKTAFALNLVKHAASNNKKPVAVAMWSLEMKAIFLVLRMMSAESKTFLYRLQTGRLSEEEMKHLVGTAVKELARLKIFFDEKTTITIQSLLRKARRLKKTQNIGMIVVDYLQLMKGDSKGNREQEIAKISRDLKNLANELDIPVIALSQLNREDGSKNINWQYGPPINSMRESGAIEMDADVIMMLWGPSEDEIAKDPTLDGKRKIKIAKQRNGVLITEELDFKNEIQLFTEIEKSAGGNFIPVRQAEEDQGKLHVQNGGGDDGEELPF